MTTFVLLFFLDQFLSGRNGDPSPGILHTKAEVRNLDCRRVSQAEANALRPGEVAEPSVRATWVARDAMICRQRYVALGERPARDEAILSSLRANVAAVTRAATGATPHQVTWHVDAFYPDTLVGAKIATAVKTELVERGHVVSDRVPLLAAGDVAVLGKVPPERALPTACARYAAEGSLPEGHVLLAVVLLDARETQLHAGICDAGAWKWVH